MGKVYDALRRAEAQRTQGGGAAPAGIAAPIERSERPRPTRRERPGVLARLGQLFQRDAARPAYADDAGAINKRRISLLHPDSFVAEQFRSLRARIDSLASERPLRTIAITSAVPGEGKTTAAVNLALVSAMGVGRRVLLVDCDLRRPRIHGALGLRPEVGLAEVLTDQASLERAIVKADGTALEVLPVRGTPANPSELLGSTRMRTLLAELSQRYDSIVLDTPPTLALPDAKILSEIADGILLVVRADETPQEDVQAALDVLDRRRVVGIVLNGAETDEQRYGY
jgi:capsular exopolysaccharide synthesis family protein